MELAWKITLVLCFSCSVLYAQDDPFAGLVAPITARVAYRADLESSRKDKVILANGEGLELAFDSASNAIRQITGVGLAHIAGSLRGDRAATVVAADALLKLNKYLELPLADLRLSTAVKGEDGQGIIVYGFHRQGIPVLDATVVVFFAQDSLIRVLNYSYSEMEVEPIIFYPADVELSLRSRGYQVQVDENPVYRVFGQQMVLAYALHLTAKNGESAEVYLNSKNREFFDLRRQESLAR